MSLSAAKLKFYDSLFKSICPNATTKSSLYVLNGKKKEVKPNKN